MSDTTEQTSQFKNRPGLGRVVGATRYSLQGLACAWKNETGFRQEIAIGVPAIVLALFLPVSRAEQAVLIGVIVLVWIVELLNSAIESAIDRISLERHPLSGNAKDQGSAAVLLAVLLALGTWGLILAQLV